MLVIAKMTPACRDPNIFAKVVEVMKDDQRCDRERVSASKGDGGERMCIVGDTAKERCKRTEQTGRERVW
jgi:hypothetical protein